MDQGAGLSLGERAYILGKVLQSIPLYFAHWEDALLAKSELDATFAALAEEAMACPDRKAFSLLLTAFLARLNNGHTRFRDTHLEDLPPLGMAIRPVEERWTVLASRVPELQAGDVVLRIEDQPVEAWYEELYPYTVGSPQARTVQFGEQSGFFRDLLGMVLPERYTLAFEDAHGAVRTATVDRRGLPGEAQRQTEGRWLDQGLAYIQIPSFLSPEYEDRALAYVQEFQQADGLIVDVRGNSGGNTPGDLTRALMDRPHRWWIESSPFNVGLLTYQALQGHNVHMFGDAQLWWRAPGAEPGPEGYKGRLILLVDRVTGSAAEDLVMPFKDNGRATLIGERTNGSTGQPFYHMFDNGMGLAIGTKRVCMPDGTPFEGVGLAPDIPVSLRREDLYAGKDLALEKAVAAAAS